jgi:cell division protein FtsI/penicillin-binding protein 2
MVSVVEGGSGYQTRMNKPGSSYKIAGKTGTAQIPRDDGKGYRTDANIGSFVGYAPVGAPKFVMMVRINEPGIGGFAEDTAVPIFRDIATWLFKYYGVAPIG